MNNIVSEPISKSSMPRLRGYSYTREEAVKARDKGRLLCLRLDTNYNCNLQCRYCYSYSDDKVKSPPMSLDKAKDIIDQGCEIGLRSVVYLGGGEPTLYTDFWPLIEYMSSKNVIPVIFTNGMLMTPQMAKRLYDTGASVIVKFDGFEDTQEKLTGEGTFKRIRAGREAILEAGFANRTEDGVTRMGVAPCMCTVNYNEIPDIWRFARRNFIFPDFERATTVGNATEDISLNSEMVFKLLDTLEKIDREEFGIVWDVPYASIPAHNCYIYLSGCHVTAYGEVSICPEIPPVAKLSDKPLARILSESPFKEARHIDKHIQGECAKCDYLDKCFGGCRSKAYYCSNSFFESDPFCKVIHRKKVV